MFRFISGGIIKQIFVSFFLFSFLYLASTGAEAMGPTVLHIPMNFGQIAILSVIFVVTLRLAIWLQQRQS